MARVVRALPLQHPTVQSCHQQGPTPVRAMVRDGPPDPRSTLTPGYRGRRGSSSCSAQPEKTARASASRRHREHVLLDELGKSGVVRRRSGTSRRQPRRRSRHGAGQRPDRAGPSARPPGRTASRHCPGSRTGGDRRAGRRACACDPARRSARRRRRTRRGSGSPAVDEHDLGVAARRGVTEPPAPTPSRPRRPTGVARRAGPVSTAQTGCGVPGGRARRFRQVRVDARRTRRPARGRRFRAPRSPSRPGRPAGPGSLPASARWRCRR